jgi:hypothetical protein
MPLSEKIKELGLEGTQRFDCSNLLELFSYFAYSNSSGPLYIYILNNS